MKLRLKLKWHSRDQEQIFNRDQTRYIVCSLGRKYGKTLGAVQWLAQRGLERRDKQCLWLAPIYKQTKIAFRYFSLLYKRQGIFAKDPNKSDLEISLVSGTVIQFRTGANIAAVEGEGYCAAVLDECWELLEDESLWYDSVRPTLMIEKGRVMFISRGGFEGTLFHDLYEKGLDENELDYKSYRRTSYNNPLLESKEIDDLKNEVPESTFRQHIEGEFLSLSERPIPNINECATAQIEEFYKPAWSPYIMGLDLAKHNDYTVITIGRRGHIVYFERFNKLSWPVQEIKIIEIAEKYQAQIVMDSTGIGDVVFDHLVDAGLNIEPIPYNFNETSRKQLLDMLILRMGYKNLRYPNIPVILSEMRSMRWIITRSGKAKLKVPDSKHDDCIMSVALCNWGMSGVLKQPKLEDIQSFGEITQQDEYL